MLLPKEVLSGGGISVGYYDTDPKLTYVKLLIENCTVVSQVRVYSSVLLTLSIK